MAANWFHLGLALSSQPSPWWPPGEGLSADNQGTDLERRRRKAPRRQTGSLSAGAECQRQRTGARGLGEAASASGPGRAEGTCLGPRGQTWGEDFLAQTGRNATYPERTRCHILLNLPPPPPSSKLLPLPTKKGGGPRFPRTTRPSNL